MSTVTPVFIHMQLICFNGNVIITNLAKTQVMFCLADPSSANGILKSWNFFVILVPYKLEIMKVEGKALKRKINSHFRSSKAA